jgi:hypothetical protein
MKKFSIGTFAILAIMLAVTSAFTLNKKPFAQNKSERFGVNVSQVSQAGNTAEEIYAQRKIDAFRAVGSQTLFTDIDAEISTYNASHSVDVSCLNSTSTICAAIVKYNDVTNPDSEYSLVDWTDGDYLLQ